MLSSSLTTAFLLNSLSQIWTTSCIFDRITIDWCPILVFRSIHWKKEWKRQKLYYREIVCKRVVTKFILGGEELFFFLVRNRVDLFDKRIYSGLNRFFVSFHGIFSLNFFEFLRFWDCLLANCTNSLFHLIGLRIQNARRQTNKEMKWDNAERNQNKRTIKQGYHKIIYKKIYATSSLTLVTTFAIFCLVSCVILLINRNQNQNNVETSSITIIWKIHGNMRWTRTVGSLFFLIFFFYKIEVFTNFGIGILTAFPSIVGFKFRSDSRMALSTAPTICSKIHTIVNARIDVFFSHNRKLRNNKDANKMKEDTIELKTEKRNRKVHANIAKN